MGNMVKERYINADTLINNLRSMSVPGYSTYGNSEMDRAVRTLINEAMLNAFVQFKESLTIAIDQAATLDGPCFLCKQRPGGVELPPDIHRA